MKSVANRIEIAQRVALGTVLVIQLTLLASGQLFVGSLVPPAVLAVPIGILVYKTSEHKQLPIRGLKEMVRSSIWLTLIVGAAYVLPIKIRPTMWFVLPVLTDITIAILIVTTVQLVRMRRPGRKSRR